MSLSSPQIAFEDSKTQMPSSLLCLSSPAELSNWAGSPSGISTPLQPLILSFFWPACSKYALCSPVDPYFLCIQYQKAIMLTVISPYADVSVQMPVATCRLYLGVQHQGCGERKIYLAKEREEGDADTCKNPLLTPQFTFCCEKELNLHVNPFKLKYPLSNSGKKKSPLSSFFHPSRLYRGPPQVHRRVLQMSSALWQSCC